MKLAVLSMVALFGLAHDCGKDDTPATAGTDPTADPAAHVWDQVYGSWSCTADARPAITFEIRRVADPASVEQQWLSDGAQGVASVHTDALYLENFKGIAYDDYGYTEQPKGTLAALDEFSVATGTAPYHCVRA